MKRKRLLAFMAVLGLLNWGGGARAQARTPDETIKRMDELQKQLDELRLDYELLREEVKGDGPKLQNYTLKGFFDISYTVEDTDREPEEKSSSFKMGQFDLFLTARLTDRISVLNETVIESDSSDNTEVDLERLWVKYTFSDRLKLKLGRLHTPIGYWHTTYHHGTWLQTTAFRPQLLQWEGHGQKGILPMHSVGLEASGAFPGRRMVLEYALNITNGRGKRSDKVQMTQDANDQKALNAYLRLKPVSIPGLAFGGNIYLDKIPPDSSIDSRNGDINERILGAYLVYLQGRYEFLSEMCHIQHYDKVRRKYHDTLGFYLQGAYQIDSFKPYYRFDFTDIAEGDPYYSPGFYSLRKHTLGLRWDFSSWSALKVEAGLLDWMGKSNARSFTTNLAFYF